MKTSCDQCGRIMDTEDAGSGRLVQGWVKKGTKNLVTMSAPDGFCCSACLGLLKSGIHTVQEKLFPV